jgi:hypothetical protein
MGVEVAEAILWGQKVKTFDEVNETLLLERARRQREEEIDNEACRQGQAINNAFRMKRSRRR